MNLAIVLDFINLFFAGILAGALFVIDYGVGRAVAAVVDEQAQMRLRQALILSLRVMVPVIFMLTILSGVAITVLDGFDAGFAFRLAGLLVVLTWQPGAPPKNWRTLVSRWQRFDRARTWAGIAAFALFLAATALKV